MKIIKILFVILVLSITSITFFSCERDDFCVENPVTPNLILRFYDKDNVVNLKEAMRLSITAQGLAVGDSIHESITTDSIAIPLNSLTNETVFILKRNQTDSDVGMVGNETATLTVKYMPENEYVSRSCGYRVIYNNVTLERDNGWISRLSVNEIESINSQINAHVNIFH